MALEIAEGSGTFSIGTCDLSTPRIFVPGVLQSNASVALEAQAGRHLTRVLRLKPGAALVVFNGTGGEYRATLGNAERGAVITVNIGEWVARDAESRLHVHLAQGISRGERMDYAVQKAVELGVSFITPLVTEYCGVTVHDERAEKRAAHWRGVAIAACEQCGRTRIPGIAVPDRLAAWLAQPHPGLKLVLDPYARLGLADVPAPHDGICLLIGPEGGLSDTETQVAVNAGFVAVRLGPRMLRTETAPVAALAAVQALWGDLA